MSVEIGLGAAIVTMRGRQPAILAENDALPSVAFDPSRHRTFEQALRSTVDEQTGLRLGYVEQLYTFGDRGRHSLDIATDELHVVSVGYLALTRSGEGATWRDWYDLFPWEDWRGGRPALIDTMILPALEEWADGVPARLSRIAQTFGASGPQFDEERALDRYELLYEAGLVPEAVRDGRAGSGNVPGRPMAHDHRRIVATALTRLRSKLKYRPVIFELMLGEFTLTELQNTAEALAGRPLHKQNFRRLVETAQLVERTGGTSAGTGGRPAALFRFRQQVVNERPATGLRIGGR